MFAQKAVPYFILFFHRSAACLLLIVEVNMFLHVDNQSITIYHKVEFVYHKGNNIVSLPEHKSKLFQYFFELLFPR